MTDLQVAEHLMLLAKSLTTDAAALERAAKMLGENAEAMALGAEQLRLRMEAIDKLGKAQGIRQAVDAILLFGQEVLS